MRQNDWQDFGKLRQFLRENKTDVMHVHWSTDVMVPGYAALKEHVPVRIMSRHMPYPFKNRLGTLLYSRVLYTRLVPVSQSVRDTLVRCGVAADKIEVIHHGTDVGAFSRTTAPPAQVRRELGIPDDCLAVGIVGRIAPEKGHAVLLEAVQKVSESYPVCCVVIGEGPDEAAMKESARTLGIADKVSVHGLPGRRQQCHQCSGHRRRAVHLERAVFRRGPAGDGAAEARHRHPRRRDAGNGSGGRDRPARPPRRRRRPGGRHRCTCRGRLRRRRMGQAGHARVEQLFSLQVMTDKIEDLYRREYKRACGEGALQKVPVS